MWPLIVIALYKADILHMVFVILDPLFDFSLHLVHNDQKDSIQKESETCFKSFVHFK